uniref:Uncharacterized protein n=1 Tax=Glossina palpalis gambiensis TaxID=67801 RepID=A0A1B0BL89_9MUSC
MTIGQQAIEQHRSRFQINFQEKGANGVTTPHWQPASPKTLMHIKCIKLRVLNTTCKTTDSSMLVEIFFCGCLRRLLKRADEIVNHIRFTLMLYPNIILYIISVFLS